MPMKLTKSRIDAVVPQPKRFVIWDSAIPGFGLTVHPKGLKTFVLKYRTVDGTQRKPTIGTYGAITLEQARDIANDILAKVRAGEDPSRARKEARMAPTVADLVDRYWNEHALIYKKPSSIKADRINIDKHVLPAFGTRKVADILLQEGEGTTLEYKESLSTSFAREMVAFANTLGGKILLGVRDDRTVAGIKDTHALRARIQNIARSCDPSVSVIVEPVGNVIVVHVREGEVKPIQCSDGFFWRQGAVTQKLSRDEIRDFFRNEGAIHFDLSVCPEFRYPQDFDREKYAAWVKLSGITGRPRTEDVLINIEAAERSSGKLLFRNAGVLFFAQNIRRFFKQAYVTCLLAKGTDKVHILDRKDFEGGMAADIEDALRFIERNTRTAYRIERLKRENVSEYPMKALREAITNAVMHRDWFIDGANVFVEIYTDRIEVVSPGGLPKGMTLADLGRKSVRRNALIADLLHRIDFIEKAGTGIKRIREEARKGGYPEPEWEVDGFVTTVFRPNPAVRDQVEAQQARQVTEQVPDKSGPSRDQVEILKECRESKAIVDLMSMTGRSNRTKFRDQVLNPLLETGLIEMTIPDKPRSSKQRYQTTTKGIGFIKSVGNKK